MLTVNVLRVFVDKSGNHGNPVGIVVDTEEKYDTKAYQQITARFGIPEDEANGSGSMRLAATLGRKLTIHHGIGSVIYARPSTPGFAEVGGMVAEAEDLLIQGE